MMLTTTEFTEAIATVPVPRTGRMLNDTQENIAARVNTYNDVVDNLRLHWSAWLYQEYGSALTSEQNKLVFAKAYADREADGYKAVETHYISLVLLILLTRDSSNSGEETVANKLTTMYAATLPN
jgi:hypothetical protein